MLVPSTMIFYFYLSKNYDFLFLFSDEYWRLSIGRKARTQEEYKRHGLNGVAIKENNSLFDKIAKMDICFRKNEEEKKKAWIFKLCNCGP